MKYRIVVSANGEKKNILKFHETKKGDIILSPRGIRHSVSMQASESEFQQAKEEDASLTNITIHPNLKSEIGSLTVNYKKSTGGQEQRQIAGVLKVKNGVRLFPVLTSIGRNIGVPRLNHNDQVSTKSQIIELWPHSGINLTTDSLAYTVVVANPAVDFTFPEDFPRNINVIRFKYFQMIFIYWLYNRPTKFRGTSLSIATEKEYMKGFEFHEILNFTNDITLAHSSIYDKLPKIQKAG